MSPIVALSFGLAVACGAAGIEWSQISGLAFTLAAFAGTIFFAAVDAWEAEPEQAIENQGPPADRGIIESCLSSGGSRGTVLHSLTASNSSK